MKNRGVEERLFIFALQYNNPFYGFDIINLGCLLKDTLE